MNRERASRYISFAVDDSRTFRSLRELSFSRSAVPKHTRLVGYACGFEPLFVAVWSPCGEMLADDYAEEIAREALQSLQWFADNDNPPPADYIL